MSRATVALLAEAGDARSLHDRRFLLPRCETPSFCKIDIDALGRLAVSVVNGHARKMVLATAIFAELRFLPLDGGHCFFPIARPAAKRR